MYIMVLVSVKLLKPLHVNHLLQLHVRKSTLNWCPDPVPLLLPTHHVRDINPLITAHCLGGDVLTHRGGVHLEEAGRPIFQYELLDVSIHLRGEKRELKA